MPKVPEKTTPIKPVMAVAPKLAAAPVKPVVAAAVKPAVVAAPVKKVEATK